MRQSSFLAVSCDRTRPAPTSADADFIAVCEQSTEQYLCKGQKKARHLPSTEWICSSLARDIGLPTPPFEIIELKSDPGVYLFGSQWLAGSEDCLTAWQKVHNSELFSRIYGVDVFTHNDDRHLGNYLYINILGEITLKPIDFSRSWRHHGWPMPDPPLQSDCNTIMTKAVWEERFVYEKPSSVLESISKLPTEWMSATLSTLPEQWLSDVERNYMIEWWVSPARQIRTNRANSIL